MNIVDKETKEIIGTVITNNRSLTLSEAMELAGFSYFEGNDTGWTKDGKTFYDDSTVELSDE